MKDEKLLDVLEGLLKKCAAKEKEIRSALDLTETEYKGLLTFEHKERISCQGFSERMNLSVSRGSRVIDRLFAKGYIDRRGESSDRRCKNVWLTEKGASIRQKIDEQRQICEERLRSSASERKIKEIMRKLIDLTKKL